MFREPKPEFHGRVEAPIDSQNLVEPERSVVFYHHTFSVMKAFIPRPRCLSS